MNSLLKKHEIKKPKTKNEDKHCKNKSSKLQSITLNIYSPPYRGIRDSLPTYLQKEKDNSIFKTINS